MERQLNPEQQVCVNTHAGYVVAMAAPGSGKTTVIDARTKAILATGADPRRFISLTFTKEGAKEMTARCGKLDTTAKLFRTFHSWALYFVTAEANSFSTLGHSLKHFPLASALEVARALGLAVSRYPEVKKNKDGKRDAANYISVCKRKGLSPYAAKMQSKGDLEDIYSEIYEHYDNFLRREGVLDFDSLICESAALLEKRPDLCDRWRYDYIQLDEAQDTDSVQWRIVELINNGNVFAVGDENQGMYSWRGSETNLVDRFTARFPGAVVLPLSVNYRSTQEIVQYCKQIAPIQNETVAKLSTPNSAGQAPEFRRYSTDVDEAKAIVNSITDMGNAAILVRTNRQLRAFEDECGERGLRYKMLGKIGFWGQHEVKDIMAFVQLMVVPNDASTVRVIRAPYDCTRGLSNKSAIVEDLQGMQAQHVDGPHGKQPLYRMLAEHPDPGVRRLYDFLKEMYGRTKTLHAGDAVKLLAERTGMLGYYDTQEEVIDNNPIENILEVIKVANRHKDLRSFWDYTVRVHRAARATKGVLTLSTIHQAKGKEWETVYVAGVNEDVLPHLKGDEEEEKRIYFVACSRAAKRLHVSTNGIASKFIKDKLPPEEATGGAETDLWAGWQLGSPL